ncbi:MAG: LysE family transporter, partial [Pseudomonadota bacterium]
MTPELLTALAAFAFVSSITPGPNNMMLMASGANFGLVRTIPHMLGVALGFVVMVVLVGLGLIGLFDAVPISYTILKVLSVAYLLYLAWKIA